MLRSALTTFLALLAFATARAGEPSSTTTAPADAPKCTRLVTAEEIATSPAEQRTRIIGCVAAALADDTRLLNEVRRGRSSETPAPISRFDESLQHADAAMKQLRRCMKEADKASEEEWPEVRDRLAAEFARYTAVLDRTYALSVGAPATATVASARR